MFDGHGLYGFEGIGEGMHVWRGNGVRTKTTVYGLISLYRGEDIESIDDDDIVSTTVIKEKKLADAIDLADHLEVYEDSIPNDNQLYKMPHGVKDIPHLFCRVDDVPTFKHWGRAVACCAYNATNEYLQHWLGRKLDRNDKDWYVKNALVTSDGLPQKNSFTVIQQLVEPYGCGISRIEVPRNSRRFEEYIPFINGLGANPFYKRDGKTTNEEAYTMMYPDVALDALGIENTPEARRRHKEEVFSGWAFECVDRPTMGSIVMTQFQVKSVGHNGGSNYRGPRSSGDLDNWWMTIKLDELKNITYIQAMDLPEYEIYPGSISYDWWKIKDGPNGKTLRELAPKTTYRSVPGTGGARVQSSANGSGITKSDYTIAKLVPLGYTVPEITKMSWMTTVDLKKDDAPERKNVLLKHDGNWELKKEPAGLLPPPADDEESEEMALCYPPLCETCQKPPGNTVEVDDKIVCQHCGSDIESSIVPVSYILDGWEPVGDTVSLLGLDDDPDTDEFSWIWDEDDAPMILEGVDKRTL